MTTSRTRADDGLYQTDEQHAVQLWMEAEFERAFNIQMTDHGKTSSFDATGFVNDAPWCLLEVKDRRGDKGENRDVDHYDRFNPPGPFIETAKSDALLAGSRDPAVHRLFAFLFRSGIWYVDVREIAHLPVLVIKRMDRDGETFDPGRYVPSSDLMYLPDSRPPDSRS